MREDQVKLLTDNRLSDGSRVLGLYVSNLVLGEWHELRYEVLATLLHGFPSNDTTGRHLRQLELAGYVERRPGGRGRSPSFRWIEPQESGCITIDPQETRPMSEDGPAPVPTYPIDPQETRPIEPVAIDTRGEDLMASLEEDDEEGEPPSVGFPHELHPKAADAIEKYDDQLSGCRGALRDYLQARVPEVRQYPYVQTVACWFDGSQDVWRLPDGGRLPSGDRPALLALALNDLAASDELIMKRPVGDPANLQTKLNVLLKQRGRDDRHDNGRGDRRAAGGEGRGSEGKGGQPKPGKFDHLVDG